MKNIDFNNEMIAEASALVIANGHSEDKAAKIWMQIYKKILLLGITHLAHPKTHTRYIFSLKYIKVYFYMGLININES
jgi:hypothetical protein